MKRIVFPSLALVAGLALPAQLAFAQAEEPVEIEGRCSYSDTLAPLIEQGHVFVECDRLVMKRIEGGVELTFAHPARLRSIEFRGTFNLPGEFEVREMRLRSRRDRVEAEGTCEFDPPGSDTPEVTCLVKSGARFFVVNFAPAD